ncbi:Wzz/FepE/Etk N-terminal domain-containing protein [Halorhodospira halophila]|uniref:Lipopolysaccharide biosynthesis n=1 Tax=Halorhodospira halophila (strain DSM 244 / SL1) TaxID=349124 RepID=A1WZL7_HALHL|nr:Wzz/FepE/Etk N-terminal domain-containing protein [Halorhodospira halophila]ABM63129.1 lipopolysaccharide biosynthesis [Halorhodospira halophila SL1]MBK1729308.1 hypothetical protein [Halorhodospira halophila]
MADDREHRDLPPAHRRDADFPAEWQDPRDDEISLIDLWLVLMRRKWVIAGVFLVCVVGGAAYAYLDEPGQRYVSALEIGTYPTGSDDVATLEDRAEVATRLRESLVPLVRYELAQEHGRSFPGVEVSVPEEDAPGGFVFLQSTAPEDRADVVSSIHQNLIQQIIDRHNDRLEVRQARFEARLESMDADLEELRAKRAERRQEAEHRVEAHKDRLERLESAGAQRKEQLTHALEEAEAELKTLRENEDRRRRQLEHAREAAEEERDALIANRDRLQARIEQLEQRRSFLQEQQELLQGLMQDFRGAETEGQGMLTDSPAALGFLLRGNVTAELQQDLTNVREELVLGLEEQRLGLDEQLQQNQQRIRDAERRLEEKAADLDEFEREFRREVAAAERRVSEKRSELRHFETEHQKQVHSAEREIAQRELRLARFEDDFEREIRRKKQEIRQYAAQGQELRATEASALAVPSGSAGQDGSLIVALSGVLGLMLGVFGAFLAEFNSRAREVAQGRADPSRQA